MEAGYYIKCKNVKVTPMKRGDFCKLYHLSTFELAPHAFKNMEDNGCCIEHDSGRREWMSDIVFEDKEYSGYTKCFGLSGTIALSLIKQFDLRGGRKSSDNNSEFIIYDGKDFRISGVDPTCGTFSFYPTDKELKAKDWEVSNKYKEIYDD